VFSVFFVGKDALFFGARMQMRAGAGAADALLFGSVSYSSSRSW
jgi:hypothetical protein